MKKTPFLLLLAAVAAWPASSASGYRNVEAGGMHYYAFTQGFPESNSIWSGLGITNDDMVYVAVSDHAINVGLFKYNPKKDTMSYLGDVLGNGKLWLHEWQGKVHTLLIQNPKDGLIYFGTDAGNAFWEGIGTAEQTFVGGHWFCIDPKTDNVTDLGLGVEYLGLKSIAVDPVYDRIFATTDPSSHFLVHDIDKGKSRHFKVFREANRDLGCINGAHEPRMTWADKWGNAYTHNEIGRLVEYVAATGDLKTLRTQIPFAAGTPTWHQAEGPSAIVPVNGGEYFYGVTYFGRLFKHVPEKSGEGRIVDMGNIMGDNDSVMCPIGAHSLALGQNGRLYYAMGGHGKFITEDSSAVVYEYDLKTGKKQLAYKFRNIVRECTGGVTDSKGNIYFAAHGQSVPAPGAKGEAKPYLVKFHPSTLKRN